MKTIPAIIAAAGIGVAALTGCSAADWGVPDTAPASPAAADEPAAAAPRESTTGPRSATDWYAPGGDRTASPPRERYSASDWYGSGGGGTVSPPRPDPPAAAAWRCSYSPTMNYDWHDDVLCSNGRDTDRPYLRAWDSFVTYDEIMHSAAEYERQLNGR